MLLASFSQYLTLVERRQNAVAEHDASVDENRPNVARLGGVDDCGDHVRARRQVQTLQVEDCDVCELACFEAAGFVRNAKSPRAVECCHAERACRGQHFRPTRDLLKQGRGAHLREHVEAIVARRSICAERDGNAVLEHLSDGRDAGAEL